MAKNIKKTVFEIGKRTTKKIMLEEVMMLGKKYWKAVGFNTLIFDEFGLQKLDEPFKELEAEAKANTATLKTEDKPSKEDMQDKTPKAEKKNDHLNCTIEIIWAKENDPFLRKGDTVKVVDGHMDLFLGGFCPVTVPMKPLESFFDLAKYFGNSVHFKVIAGDGKGCVWD